MNYAFGSHPADFAFHHVPHSGDSAVAIIVGSDAINTSLQAGLLTASRISFMFCFVFLTQNFSLKFLIRG